MINHLTNVGTTSRPDQGKKSEKKTFYSDARAKKILTVTRYLFY